MPPGPSPAGTPFCPPDSSSSCRRPRVCKAASKSLSSPRGRLSPTVTSVHQLEGLHLRPNPSSSSDASHKRWLSASGSHRSRRDAPALSGTPPLHAHSILPQSSACWWGPIHPSIPWLCGPCAAAPPSFTQACSPSLPSLRRQSVASLLACPGRPCHPRPLQASLHLVPTLRPRHPAYSSRWGARPWQGRPSAAPGSRVLWAGATHSPHGMVPPPRCLPRPSAATVSGRRQIAIGRPREWMTEEFGAAFWGAARGLSSGRTQGHPGPVGTQDWNAARNPQQLQFAARSGGAGGGGAEPGVGRGGGGGRRGPAPRGGGRGGGGGGGSGRPPDKSGPAADP